MAGWEASAGTVRKAARELRARLGPPSIGVVLGSGFHPLAAQLGAGPPVDLSGIEGYPTASVEGHDGGVATAVVDAARAWIFRGRLHLYDGLDPAEVALPVRILAEAGANTVVLTTAAGGVDPGTRPGDLVAVVDHLNMTGEDVVASVPAAARRPAFLDLQGVYDPDLAEILTETARRHGSALGRGVLAGMRGPCYETPAEVRMLRRLGADLVSMSTVIEASAARYLGLRVAAIACVANRGAGLDTEPIDHGTVLTTVAAAVGDSRWLGEGIGRVARGTAVGR